MLYRWLQTVSEVFPANSGWATLGKQADRGPRDTAELGSRSLANIQTGRAFVWSESPNSLRRSEDFRDWAESSVQEVSGRRLHGMSTKSYSLTQRRISSHLAPLDHGWTLLVMLLDLLKIRSFFTVGVSLVRRCVCYGSAWCVFGLSVCVCSSHYGSSVLNWWSVSGTVLWISWLLLNFSSACACCNPLTSSVLRSLPTLVGVSLVPSDLI